MNQNQDFEYETIQVSTPIEIPFGRENETCEFSLVISRKKFDESRYGVAVVRLVINRKNTKSPRIFYLPVQSLDEMSNLANTINTIAGQADVVFNKCQALNKQRQQSIDSDRMIRIEEHNKIIDSLASQNKNTKAGKGLSRFSNKSKTEKKKTRTTEKSQ